MENVCMAMQGEVCGVCRARCGSVHGRRHHREWEDGDWKPQNKGDKEAAALGSEAGSSSGVCRKAAGLEMPV